jgi:hypothetical protein
MNPHDDPHETALRRLFAAREQRDEAAAPGYEQRTKRPARARSKRWRRVSAPWAPWAAATLLFLALGVGIVWKVRSGADPSRVPADDSPTLETWKPPTDFLLAVPGGELLDSTPAFPDPDLIPSTHPRRL